MKIKFWGVRGSIPSPGPDTIRYGGNTSCVSIQPKQGGLVIVDMGTGLMHLGNTLLAGEFGKGQGKATILLSHTHWDHIQGLGFFPPVFIPGNQFTVWGPGGSPEILEEILEGQMDPNFSPLQSLKNFAAKFDVRAAPCNTTDAFEAEGLRVTAREHPHGSTTALAFRIEEDGRTFVYSSDVGQPIPNVPPSPEYIAFCRGADVLLHDTTYTPEDQERRRNRGFSTYEDAASVAVEAGVKKLVMFHYDQDYSDDDLDVLCKAARTALDKRGGKKIQLVPAREGEELEI